MTAQDAVATLSAATIQTGNSTQGTTGDVQWAGWTKGVPSEVYNAVKAAAELGGGPPFSPAQLHELNRPPQAYEVLAANGHWLILPPGYDLGHGLAAVHWKARYAPHGASSFFKLHKPAPVHAPRAPHHPRATPAIAYHEPKRKPTLGEIPPTFFHVGRQFPARTRAIQAAAPEQPLDKLEVFQRDLPADATPAQSYRAVHDALGLMRHQRLEPPPESAKGLCHQGLDAISCFGNPKAMIFPGGSLKRHPELGQAALIALHCDGAWALTATWAGTRVYSSPLANGRWSISCLAERQVYDHKPTVAEAYEFLLANCRGVGVKWKPGAKEAALKARVRLRPATKPRSFPARPAPAPIPAASPATTHPWLAGWIG